MKPIPHNHRSDLALVEIFYRHDAETNEIVAAEIPDTEIDFEFVYRAEDDRSFTAGRKGGTYFNCKPISNKSVEVYIPLSRRSLGTGPLIHFLQLHTPNGNFPEEVQNICVPASTGYFLHKGPSATVSTAAVSVLGTEVFGRMFAVEIRHDGTRTEAECFYPADTTAAGRAIRRYLSADRDTTQMLLVVSDDATGEKSYGLAIVVNDVDDSRLLFDGQVWLGEKRYDLQLAYDKATAGLGKITGRHLPTGLVQTSGDSPDHVMSQQAVTREIAQTREDFEAGDADVLNEAKQYTYRKVTNHEISSTAHTDIRELLATRVGLPTFNAQDYTLTFTAQNGATVVFDLPLETMGLDYDAAKKEMIYTNADGSKRRISLTEFIDIYVGSVGSEIQITVDIGNVIRATLLNGAVSWDKLSATLQNTINGIANTANAAETAANNAQSAANDAKTIAGVALEYAGSLSNIQTGYFSNTALTKTGNSWIGYINQKTNIPWEPFNIALVKLTVATSNTGALDIFVMLTASNTRFFIPNSNAAGATTPVLAYGYVTGYASTSGGFSSLKIYLTTGSGYASISASVVALLKL